MNKNLRNYLESAIERGRNEEVGSIDVTEVINGIGYYVVKSSEREFSLYREDDILPIEVISINK